MPIRYHIDPEAKLVIAVHVGVVPDDEFLATYHRLYADARFDKSFNQLIDLRQTESTARSAAALRAFSEFVQEEFKGTAASPKVAVIAPRSVSFGLARMYEALSDGVPWEFVVFRAADAALAWLRVPESVIDRLGQDFRLHDTTQRD
jgi:hypothetical protein